MAYIFDEPRLGMLQITAIDAGVTPPNQSTAIPTPPTYLGEIARATDPTYGGGEFILLLGVASTVTGNLVTYNATTYQTVRALNTANSGNPVAVAMSANLAATFGWYQIEGQAVIKKTAVKVAPQVPMFISATTGRTMATVSTGRQILGAKSANLATVTSTTSTVIVMINRPHVQGQII